MIPMIIVALFYAPALLPFVSLVLAINASFKLGKLGHSLGLAWYQAAEHAYSRLTDRLLASRLFPAF